MAVSKRQQRINQVFVVKRMVENPDLGCNEGKTTGTFSREYILRINDELNKLLALDGLGRVSADGSVESTKSGEEV